MTEINESAMLAELGLPDDFAEKHREPADETPDVEREDAPEVEREPEPDPEEVSARQRGWTSRKEWEEQGKDPDDWVNARHFNEKGRLIHDSRELKQMMKEFDSRIANVKAFTQMQGQMQMQALQAENEKLKEEKIQAISYADHAAVERIDQQLMNNAVGQINLQQQMQPQQPQVSDVVKQRIEKEAEWNRNNAWIHDGSEKAQYAINLYNQLDQQDPNSTFEHRIQVLNAELEKRYPTKPAANPNRDKPAMTDSKPPKSKSGELTMADLTRDERKAWDVYGSAQWGDNEAGKKRFLKVVADARRGE